MPLPSCTANAGTDGVGEGDRLADGVMELEGFALLVPEGVGDGAEVRDGVNDLLGVAVGDGVELGWPPCTTPAGVMTINRLDSVISSGTSSYSSGWSAAEVCPPGHAT